MKRNHEATLKGVTAGEKRPRTGLSSVRRLFQLNRLSKPVNTTCLVLAANVYASSYSDSGREYLVLTVFQPPIEEGESYGCDRGVYRVYCDDAGASVLPMHVYDLRCVYKTESGDSYRIDTKRGGGVSLRGTLTQHPDYNPAEYAWPGLEVVDQSTVFVGCVEAVAVDVGTPCFLRKMYRIEVVFGSGDRTLSVDHYMQSLDSSWTQLAKGDRVVLLGLEGRKLSERSDTRYTVCQMLLKDRNRLEDVSIGSLLDMSTVGTLNGAPVRACDVKTMKALIDTDVEKPFKVTLKDPLVQSMEGPYTRRCFECGTFVTLEQDPTHKCERMCYGCRSIVRGDLWSEHECVRSGKVRAPRPFLNVSVCDPEIQDVCIKWYNYRVPQLGGPGFDSKSTDERVGIVGALVERIEGVVFSAIPRNDCKSGITIDSLLLRNEAVPRSV